MTKQKKVETKFRSPAEERAFWDARSPLAPGKRGRVSTEKAKRSSFLAVRMTAAETGRLRELAARAGVGPSTYARMVLSAAIEREGRGRGLGYVAESGTEAEATGKQMEALGRRLYAEAVAIMKESGGGTVKSGASWRW